MSLALKYEELRVVTYDYVRSAMSLVGNVYEEGPSRTLRGLEEWRRDPDKLFRRYDREEPCWVECIRSHERQIHSLPEYGRLIEAIRSIPEISGQLETLVGTVSQAHRIETNDVTDRLIWILARLSGGFRFDELQFYSSFEKFLSDLCRTSIDYYAVCPLLGVKLEVAPLVLEPGIVVDHMTDDEISRCLSAGFLPTWPRAQPFANLESVATVRVQYQLSKRIGDCDQPSSSSELGQITGAHEKALDVLHALRVFRPGQVTVPGVLQFSTQWPLEGGISYHYMNPGTMPWFNKYILHAPDCEEFHVFWKNCRLVMGRGSTAGAIRRFSYASDRDRDDDRLVDLMIAAESLFLSDAGAPQERGELRYRLALRAAFFIETSESSRIGVFRHMKRAYDARSSIVHGGEISNELLKSLNDTPISIKEFVQVTGNLVRIAIKKRTEMVAAKGNSGVDWDALIIPSV